MKNINDKAKKRLIIVGGILLCAVLVILISTSLQKEPVTDTAVPETSVITGEVVVDDSRPTESTELMEPAEKEEVTVPAIEVIDSPVVAAADDSGTEQTIQADIPEKPTYTEEQLMDPTRKPNGEKIDPPKDNFAETSQTPKEPSKSTEPQGGDTKDGQIYLPGFGWVKDEGGGGEGITAEDMYENGNKIGEMN